MGGKGKGKQPSRAASANAFHPYCCDTPDAAATPTDGETVDVDFDLSPVVVAILKRCKLFPQHVFPAAGCHRSTDLLSQLRRAFFLPRCALTRRFECSFEECALLGSLGVPTLAFHTSRRRHADVGSSCVLLLHHSVWSCWWSCRSCHWWRHTLLWNR